jgi:Putative zinc-finger
VTAPCAAARQRFEGYLADALAPEERAQLRAHLAGCGDCRRAASSLEPTLLFAVCPFEEVPPAEVERILAAVRTGIALKEAEAKVSRGALRRHRAPAAVAAALALLTLALPGSSRRAAPELPTPIASQTSPSGAEPFTPVAQPASPGTFPTEATIYDWNPGVGREEPRVVWIVDRSLDI